MEHLKKRLIVHTTYLAVIILTASILQYLISAYLYNLPSSVRTFVFLLFPHEIGGQLKQLLFQKTGSYQLFILPLFSFLFYVLLRIGIDEFRKTGNTFLIIISCVLLIISIVSAFPDIFRNYNIALDEYQMYTPVESTGFTGFITDFDAPQKPSLALVIARLLILTGYIVWAAFILKLVKDYKKAVIQLPRT